MNDFKYKDRHISIPTLSLNSTRSTIELTKRNQFENFMSKVNSNRCNDSYDDIYQSIVPQFERLKRKEYQVNDVLKEATQFCDEYKKRRNEANDEVKKIDNKKEKLRYVYHSLYQFKDNLRKKEEELKEREKALNLYEESLKKNEEVIKGNSLKFEIYMKEKGEELKRMANEIKEIKEKNEITNVELLKREEELQLRENKLIINEENLRNQIENIKKEQDNIINKKEDEQLISTNYIQSNNLPNKDNDIVIEDNSKESKEEIEKKAMLIRLNEEITLKKKELMNIDNEVKSTNEKINLRLDELNERLKNVIQREKEINLLKFTLEDKLNYINKKLKLTYEITSNK